MITAERVLAIGTDMATDPGRKNNPELSRLQAIINLTSVMQMIAVVLIDIRDGNKAGPK
jgi:hypothetical protein